MKKPIALAIALILALSLSACSRDSNTQSSAIDTPTPPTDSLAPSPPTESSVSSAATPTTMENEEEVLDAAELSEVQGCPGMVLAADIERYIETGGDEGEELEYSMECEASWEYGWYTENGKITPEHDNVKHPVCLIAVAKSEETPEEARIILNFDLDVENSMLFPVGGIMDDGSDSTREMSEYEAKDIIELVAYTLRYITETSAMREDAILEQAELARLEGYPDVVLVSAIEAQVSNIEEMLANSDTRFSAYPRWYFGWTDLTKEDFEEIRPTLEADEEPVRLDMDISMRRGTSPLVFVDVDINFIFETVKNVLIPVDCKVSRIIDDENEPPYTTVLNADESAAVIMEILNNAGLKFVAFEDIASLVPSSSPTPAASNPPAASASPSASSSSTPTASASSSPSNPIEISNLYGEQTSEEYFRVSGTVTNTSDRPLHFVRLTIYILDAQGRNIGSGDTYAVSDSPWLMPGESEMWEAPYIGINENMDSYTVEIDSFDYAD